MTVDVIILTNSDLGRNSNITKRTLQSLHDSETEHQFNVIMVESGEFCYQQYKSFVNKYITPGEKFNYNRFLNFAIEYTTSDWVLISNDDVGYEIGWFSEIMKVYKERPDIESFSPKDPMLYMLYFDGHFVGSRDTYYESYKVSESIMGWSILVKKTALDKIGPFDEQFDMYYQDNDYGEMLKRNGIKHALVRNSIAVHHGTMRVTDVLSDAKVKKIQEDELKFRTKWNIWT
jgi:hypothetical protein